MNYNYYFLNTSLLSVAIAIEMDLYKKEFSKFDVLLMNFEKTSTPMSNNCYYVKEYTLGDCGICDKVVYINLSDSKWLYYLFTVIECIIIKNLSSQTICLHGSGIFSNHGSIIFVGKKNIGKSTIIKKLLKLPQYSYVDDDIIMVSEGLVWGPGLPMKSRECDSICAMECNGETRYLTNYIKKSSHPQKVMSIIYPTYNATAQNELKVLSASQSFRYLYENIKTGEVSLCIKTLVELSVKCQAFKLTYSTDEFLYASIENIINNIQ